MDRIMSPPSPSELDRYLAGEATPEEAARVKFWVAANPQRMATATALKTLGRDTVTPMRPLRARWDELRPAVIPPQPRRTRPARTPRITPVRWGLFAVGAIGVLVAGSTVVRESWQGQAQGHAQQQYQTYTTTAGQRLQVSLPDGSQITLAPRSKLDVHLDVHHEPGHTRTVRLEGQAFFSVTNGADVPFEVQTGQIVTRVLGTSFDVRHYTDDDEVQVAVTSGKVAVSGSRQSVTLTAGSVGYVTDSTATSAIVSDLTPYTMWKDGRLVFKDAPIDAMLATLGRWYGYEFKLADSTLAGEDVTVTIDVNDTRMLLATLRHVLGVSVSVADSIVTLTPNQQGRATARPPQRRIDRQIWPPSTRTGR